MGPAIIKKATQTFVCTSPRKEVNWHNNNTGTPLITVGAIWQHNGKMEINTLEALPK
jgi:hypothetical protein